MTAKLKPLTEVEFTRQVLTLAVRCGFLAAHFRPGRTARGWRTAMSGHVGYPDLTLCHPGRGLFLVAELKCGRGRLTVAQQAWLAAFRAAGVPAYCWHPEDWPEIERVLEG